jgi:DNA-binding IclR family transcriptional regulator
MPSEPIPESLRRFVLTSVPSVPWVEALLLFRNANGVPLDTGHVARNLYIAEPAAAEVLAQLAAARVVVRDEDTGRYRYAPGTPELAERLDTLASHYSSHLVELTDLIHSNRARSAHQFADAFKVRKD